MMKKLSASADTDTHLSSYRIPDLTFDLSKLPFDSIGPVWTALANGEDKLARSIAHNRLFNAAFPPDTEVLGFEPDWSVSTSDPEFR